MPHPSPRDYANAVQWARDLLELRNFYVLDTETTGFNKTDEIVQIGVVDKYGEVVLNSLVRPTIPCPKEATAVHGITNEQLASAPPLDELYARISGILAGETIIAYNMDFDWRLIQQSFAVYQIPMFRPKKRDCAMKKYAQYRGVVTRGKPDYKWFKLSEAAAHEKIPVMNAHDAVGDVLMTLRLIERMAKD